MTYRDNIKAILEANFIGFNEEYLDRVCSKICGIQPTEKSYEDGLNDAWECAKKISLSGDDGGIPYEEFKDIFGYSSSPYGVFRGYTITKAIAKIKEYEEKQKPKFANCSILNDECAYPYITCDKCEVHCSIARARQKLKEDKE